MRTASPVISSELLRRGHQISPSRHDPPARLPATACAAHHAAWPVPKRGAAANRLELRVRPGLKRVFDYFAYTISGLALVGGVTYGLQRLSQSPAAVPATAPAAQVPVAADSGSPTAAAASPPDRETNQAVSADTRLATNQSSMSAADPGQTDANGETAEQAALFRDQATYYTLQRNCYEAANNNQNGDYPALQASACNRYAQFAYSRGWNTGTLPAYGQPAPQTAPIADSPVVAQPDLSDQAQAQTQPQVIILNQNFVRERQGDGHRPHDQFGGNNSQPPRQSGPNYSLPPLQQPPEVFQPHHGEPTHGRTLPGQSR